MICWKDELAEASEGDGPIIACTRTDAEMSVKFNGGYGSEEGCSFTAWSEKRVYFPVCYDGAEWVGSAPRNPCEEHTRHVGGG